MDARPFRFGVMVREGSDPDGVKQLARQVESLGYYSFLYNDHYLGPGPAMEAASHPPQDVAAIPAAVLAADATTTLRVGFRVLCIDYHNPVVLAKSMATLDRFSGGRLEIGLGAGWLEPEYDAMNVRYDRPGIRINRLAAVIELLRRCFADGEVKVDAGNGVAAHGFEGTPKPVQRPSPPIAVGGGARRVLELAAREADIVAFNLNNRAGIISADGFAVSSATATDERIGWVRDAAGARAADIELEIGAHFTTVTDDPMPMAEGLSGFFGIAPDEVLRHPHVLIGTVDAIADALRERRERWGFSYIVVQQEQLENFAPVVEKLAGT
jgi:probable F420-dependent oxidoreductase